MPTSLAAAMMPYVNFIQKVKPKTILDIGIGYGKYGLLTREYMAEHGGVDRVDGVEIFSPYITDVQRSIYDNIYIEDIRTFNFGKYDVYIFVDVIEHMSKEEGHKVLDRMDGYVFISTPRIFVEQENTYGNDNENHISLWDFDDFSRYPMCDNIFNDYQLVIVLDLRRNKNG